MASEVFILMPTYNCEKFVGEAIASVLAQTFNHWSLLVLDDCSSDQTYDIAIEFSKKDDRIIVIRNEKNLGMVNNWNKGISYCNSEFFVKLDGDDSWSPEMLALSLEKLKQDASVGIVFTSFVNIDEEGKMVEGSRPAFPAFASDQSFSCVPLVKEGSDKMLSYPILRQGLSVMRSRIFSEIGNYRFLLTESTQASSDTEFYFRVGLHYKIYSLDKPLYYYRIHNKSISAVNKQDGIQEKKLYEVKTVIIDYYYSQGVIEKKFYQENRRQIKFKYLLFLSYRARKENHMIVGMLYLAKIIIQYPILAFAHLRKR
jgi:glycosyltransferase involved in cell wall biosynthesis